MAATAAHLTDIEIMLGALVPLVEAGDAGDSAAQRRVIETLVREVSLATELVPPYKRKQKGPQRRASVRIRYLFSPTSGRELMCGSIPSDQSEGILPHSGGLILDSEFVVVRAYHRVHASGVPTPATNG